jgi:hypothetical protein
VQSVSTSGHGAPSDYEQRYCAFIDILGFSEVIQRLRSDPGEINQVRTLLRSVHAPVRGDWITSHRDSDLKAQSISDAVCLSARCSPAGLLHLFFSIDQLALTLLEAGYFIRGAIVKGQLYADDNMAFGEALVRAYHLEQNVVRFPRVMVTHDIVKEVRDDFLEKRDISEFLNRLDQGVDGPHYLHILNELDVSLRFDLPAIPSEAQRRESAANVDKCNRMARQIQQRLDEAVDNPRHFEKVQWFASYWNGALGIHTRTVSAINGPGVGPAHQW